jgi:hypothetical protein
VAQFEAVVESARGGGHYVAVPDQAAAEIGARHMLRVKGTLAGAAYRSNLAKLGGRLILGVHKATLKAAAKTSGDEVTVSIEVDNEPR